MKYILEYREYKSDYNHEVKLLRKLTKKSVLGFGKYRKYFNWGKENKRLNSIKEDTIGDILEYDNHDRYKIPKNFKDYWDDNDKELPIQLKDGHSYLRWVYYNIENINFMDDILNELGISEEFRIPKPGKDDSILKTLNRKLLNELLTPDEIEVYFKQKSYNRKESDAIDRELIDDDDINIESKKTLQLRNQGKIK